MLDQQLAQKYSSLYENKMGGLFKKYNLDFQKLDKKTDSRKPDYLVTNSSNKKMIVECKYVVSAGMTRDRKHHISTLDPSLPDHGVFQPNSFEKYREVLLDARSQFNDLVNTNSQYKNIPFVVSIGSDFFADGFNFVPSNIYGITEISAIMTIERGIEQRKFFQKFSYEELEKMILGELRTHTPPESVRFKVLLNNSPKIEFNPYDFLRNPIVVDNR